MEEGGREMGERKVRVEEGRERGGLCEGKEGGGREGEM